MSGKFRQIWWRRRRPLGTSVQAISRSGFLLILERLALVATTDVITSKIASKWHTKFCEHEAAGRELEGRRDILRIHARIS